MEALCIGIAELFLLISIGGFIRPRAERFVVEGLGGILIALAICYGMGRLTLILLELFI